MGSIRPRTKCRKPDSWAFQVLRRFARAILKDGERGRCASCLRSLILPDDSSTTLEPRCQLCPGVGASSNFGLRLMVGDGYSYANEDAGSAAFDAARARCGAGSMPESSFAASRDRTNDFRLCGVIARSGSLLWRHLITFFVVGLFASLPVLLLVKPPAVGAAVGPAVGPVVGPALLSRLLWYIFASGLLIAAGTLGQAVIICAALQDMPRRGVAGLVQSLNVSLRQFWPLAGLILWGFVTVLGFALLIVPGLVLSTIWFVGLPACLADQLGPWASLRRICC